MERLIIFFWYLSLDSRDVHKIVEALSQRQANGRSDLYPYEKAKQLIKRLSL